MALDSESILSGLLFKRGSGGGIFGRRNWKLRYFVLTSSSLQYYSKQNGRLRGTLSLAGCEKYSIDMMPVESLQLKHCAGVSKWRLAIHTPERRLLLAACTETEMKTWATKLAQAFRLYLGKSVRMEPMKQSVSYREDTYPTCNDTELMDVADLLEDSDRLEATDLLEVADSARYSERETSYIVLDDLDGVVTSYIDEETPQAEPVLMLPFGRPKPKLSSLDSSASTTSSTRTSSSFRSSVLFFQRPQFWKQEPQDEDFAWRSTLSGSVLLKSTTYRNAARTQLRDRRA